MSWPCTCASIFALAQSGKGADSPVVTVILAVILIIAIAVAALMSSKRGHRD